VQSRKPNGQELFILADLAGAQRKQALRPGAYAMNERSESRIHRRSLLAWGLAGATATVVASQMPTPIPAAPTGSKKMKARYEANSAEVRNFYRVNRYPVR
jgi:hypothetical protein